MSERRRAAIAGVAGWAPQRRWDTPMFGLEAYGRLAREALEDAGMELGEIDEILCTRLADAARWSTSAGRMRRRWSGADAWGAPHGQFDAPYDLINPNSHFAMVAQRYMYEYDLAPETLAKTAVHERDNALQNPKAIFRDQPITIADVLDSSLVADPLHLLEIVMPCSGGAGVVVTTLDRARRTGLRPALVSGSGEHVTHKSITYAPSLTQIPIRAAADRAFAMPGASPDDVDTASMYDCYMITVLVTIEDSGFCAKGEGPRFVQEHDLRYTGDWPLNTHGGQLGMGQGGAGACPT